MDKKFACKITRSEDDWGTGYLISPQTIITAYHVVKDAESVQIEFVHPEIESFDLKLNNAILCWHDESLDVALLRCEQIPIDLVPPHPRQVCLPDRPLDVFFQAFPRFAVEDLKAKAGEQYWDATIEKFAATDTCADVKYQDGPLDRSRWGGASGALLFEDKVPPQRPVAVLTHRQDRDMEQAQLWATPLYALLHGDSTREAFRKALGWDQMRLSSLRESLAEHLIRLRQLAGGEGYRLLLARLGCQQEFQPDQLVDLLLQRDLADLKRCLRELVMTEKPDSLPDDDHSLLLDLLDLLLPLRYLETRPDVSVALQSGKPVLVSVGGGRPFALAEVILAGADGKRAKWVPLYPKQISTGGETSPGAPPDFAGRRSIKSWAPPTEGDAGQSDLGKTAWIDRQAANILAAIVAISGELYTGKLRALVLNKQMGRDSADDLKNLAAVVSEICAFSSAGDEGRSLYCVVQPPAGDTRWILPYHRIQELIPQLAVVQVVPATEGNAHDLGYGELVYVGLVKKYGMRQHDE